MQLGTPHIPNGDTQIAHFTAGSYSLRNAVLEVLRHKPHFLCETIENKSPGATELEAMQLMDARCETGISLFARTCYHTPVAENITAALAEHYHLSGSHINNIHLCLHEAIINGVVHGNLSVPGIFKTKDALGGYYEWIEAWLATPSLSASRIQVLSSLHNDVLVLEVIDQGRGYQFQEYLRNTDALELHQGLNLIRVSCDLMQVLGCGNHIRMEFGL